MYTKYILALVGNSGKAAFHREFGTVIASGVGIGKEFGDIYNDTNIPFLDVGGIL